MIQRTVHSVMTLLVLSVVLAGAALTPKATFAAIEANTSPASVVSAPAKNVSLSNHEGRLKICKLIEDNSFQQPTPGLLFLFDVTGPDPDGPFRVALTAGSCSFLTVDPGAYRVQELNAEQLPSGATTDDFQVTRIVLVAPTTGGTDVGRQRATVNVVTGRTSEVRFYNEFVSTLLKVCKVLATGTTAEDGVVFRFRIGNTVRDIAPNTCTIVRVPARPITIVEEVNERYAVAPTVRDNYVVVDIQFIAQSAGGPGTADIPNQTAVAFPEDGIVTEVEFTNAGFGFIQICKETVGDLTGLFRFDSPSFRAPFLNPQIPAQTIDVDPGETEPVCGPLLKLFAGQHTIREVGATADNGLPVVFVGGRTEPASRLRGVNVANRTITFAVPVGNSMDQTLVIFNNAQLAYIQICKETDEGLTGGTFRFLLQPRGTLAGHTVVVEEDSNQPVCGGLITVYARPNFKVIERETTPATTFAGGRTIPVNRLVSVNLAERSITANVPPGPKTDQTLFIFRNTP